MSTPTFNLKGLELILRGKLTAAQLQIINNMRATGKVASGNTIRNINAFTEVTADGVHGSITAPMFSFLTTETGRKGGKVPANFYQIIYKWTLDKNLQFQKNWKRKSFAWCVAQKIAKMGTQQYRQGKRTDIYTDVTANLVKDIKKELADGKTINDLYDILGKSVSSEITSIKAKI